MLYPIATNTVVLLIFEDIKFRGFSKFWFKEKISRLWVSSKNLKIARSTRRFLEMCDRFEYSSVIRGHLIRSDYSICGYYLPVDDSKGVLTSHLRKVFSKSYLTTTCTTRNSGFRGTEYTKIKRIFIFVV